LFDQVRGVDEAEVTTKLLFTNDLVPIAWTPVCELYLWNLEKKEFNISIPDEQGPKPITLLLDRLLHI